MIRALITGGAGFIGFHLIKRLLSEEVRVICIDNFYTGSEKNIEEFLKSDNFRFIKHDITEQLEVKENIDEVYNLACPASPFHYQKDPIFTWLTNVYGTKNMMDLALKKGAKFFQASTSEVYGDPLEHPQKESYFGNVNPIGKRACYDEGKRAAETICRDYARTKNLDVKIVRIFNTYGPKMAKDDGRVISNFIIQALRGEPITVYGDGTQTRSFQYIDDLIEGMLRMMRSPETGPLNLGNPKEYAIKELAETIKRLTLSSSKIIYQPLPEDDPERRRPDITKAKTLLSWEPAVSLEDGLKKTIDFFKSAL